MKGYFRMADILSPAQRRTLIAREAPAAKFTILAAKRDYYRRIGEHGNAGRIVLRPKEAAALAEAAAVLAWVTEAAGANV